VRIRPPSRFAALAVAVGAALLLTSSTLVIPVNLVAWAAPAPAGPPSSRTPDWIPTGKATTEAGPSFAIVAYDSATASWGVACAASEIACGARVLSAAAGAGAVASLGPGPAAVAAALATLASGTGADSALARARSAGEDPSARQWVIVAADGRSAVYSGARLPGFSGARMGKGFGCAGYGLRGEETLEAMAEALAAGGGAAGERSARELGARLLAALEAGARAEGDPFLRHGSDASAALLVVRAGADPASGSDRLADLRVDRDDDPVAALGRLYARHAQTFLPAAHVRFGDAARRRGDEAAAAREYAVAEAGFRAAVARAPKDGDALNELAWFLATHGADPSEALRFAEAAVAARGDDPNLLDTLAEAAYRAGNLERAIEAAERAARLAHGNARYVDRLRAFRAAREAMVPSTP